MQELPSERRRYLRVNDVLDIEFEQPDRESAARSASSLDIAGGGIRLTSANPVKKGDMVWVRFNVPTPEGGREVECLCEVRWVQPGDEEAGGRFLFGVSFFDIEEEDRELLTRYVFAKHYGIEREDGPALSVRDLRKNYGRIEALRGVSFEVERGEIFAVLGPNGAGKSTLTRILCTLLRPSSGAADVLGLDLLKQRHEIRRSVGYMPQAYVLYDDLTAVENLRFFGRAYGLHGRTLADLIDEALEFTELADRANDLFRTFSGGMRQRLSLACTFIHRPKILFLDEPTAGVDLKLRKSFWDYFHQLSEIGVTIFVTTHQMDEVEYCRRVACIHGGRIIVDDTPGNIHRMGFATVTFTIRGAPREFKVQDFKSALPGLIRDLGPDAADIDSVDIAESTLEEILRDRIMSGGGAG